MLIRNEQPQRRDNHELLSHKCPLGGSFDKANQKNSSNKGRDHVVASSKKYQCHKFRRVCMIMGVLVLIEESENGSVSYQELMPKDYIHQSGRQNKCLLKHSFLKEGFPTKKKFNITTQVFQQDAQPNVRD